MIPAWIIGLWVVCSVFTFGVANNTYKKEFPYHNGIRFGLLLSLAGPIGLVSVLFANLEMGFSSGIEFKPATKEERWQKFDQMYNRDSVFMTREQFDQEY